MNDPVAVDVFQKLKRKIVKVGLFLSVKIINARPQFVIGPKKYSTKILSTIDKHSSACTQDKCPLAVLDSLEEIEAFVLGFCTATGKKVPL